jgi:hypothetical protein
MVSAAVAQTNWTDATGSWFVSGNWSAGVPSAATTTTTVGNGGTALISGAPANAGNNLVINGGSTVDVQTGGSLAAGSITVGPNGTLSLGGGSVVSSSVMNFANINIGSGGTFNLNGTLTSGLPSSVTMLSGGTLNATSTSLVTDTINFGVSTTSTISAAAGQTLTFNGNIVASEGASVKIGSATDTGTAVFAPR